MSERVRSEFFPRSPPAILGPMAASAPTKPGSVGQRQDDSVEATQRPWVTIVWDDPVNLMNYVTYILQKLFGYSEPHATVDVAGAQRG